MLVEVHVLPGRCCVVSDGLSGEESRDDSMRYLQRKQGTYASDLLDQIVNHGKKCMVIVQEMSSTGWMSHGAFLPMGHPA